MLSIGAKTASTAASCLFTTPAASASDADTFFDQYFHTGITKRIGYSNPEADKLIEKRQHTADQKKRVTILQQAGRQIMEDAPFVPLYTLVGNLRCRA